jgi:hypothetical protein
MPSDGTFDDPLSEGLQHLDHNRDWADDARCTFESAFEAQRPEGISPEAWLAKLHEYASDGVWDQEFLDELDAEAERLVEKARAEYLQTPVDPEVSGALGPDWGSDGDGNWFTEDAAIWITEAGKLYKDLSSGWAGYAEYWTTLLEEFEADPDGFVTQVLGTDAPDG